MPVTGRLTQACSAQIILCTIDCLAPDSSTWIHFTVQEDLRLYTKKGISILYHRCSSQQVFLTGLRFQSTALHQILPVISSLQNLARPNNGNNCIGGEQV